MVLVARLGQLQTVGKTRRSSESGCSDSRGRIDTCINSVSSGGVLGGDVQAPGLKDIFSWLTGSRGMGQIGEEEEEQDTRDTAVKNSSGHINSSGDSAVRFLGFVSAASEAISDVMPPSAINACYAMAIAKVVNACHEVAEATHACQHRYRVWNGQSIDEEEETINLPGGGLGRRPISARKALLRDSIKLFMTVAMPTLMLHAVEKSGWDMLTGVPGVMDALQAAAEQLAQGLHIPNTDLVKMLAQGLPSIAGSYLAPMLTRPVERIVEGQMERKFRPALHEFLSCHSLSCSQSFVKAVSKAMSSAMSPRLSANSGVSFLSHTMSLTSPQPVPMDSTGPSPALWQSYTTLGILFNSIAPAANGEKQHSSRDSNVFGGDDCGGQGGDDVRLRHSVTC